VVAKTLQSVVRGETLITTAMIEPGNENPLAPKTTAQQQGDEFIINGEKHCVPYAADSSKVMISAMHNHALWVGLVNLDAPGLTVTTQYCTSGEPQYHLHFNNVPANEITQGDSALQLMQTSIAMTTIAYCSMASGIAEKMTRISADYTSQRQQFGVPIATFQSVAHRLSNAYIDTECLKIITLKAASDITRGDMNNTTLSMAKVWCGDVMHRVSQTSQHVHGGTGIDRDYHLFRYCLWAKQLELSLGNSRTHLVNIADRLASQYLANA
jgi:alkylation response protein AidB-like acyl-CoA dehydrogenase